ncbi:MAG: signal protein [Acidimicrobiia bacterium]|nr:signal protein [Acidimicrobiia bacterium]
MRTRTGRPIAVAVLVAAALAGCSGSTGTSKAAPTSPASASTSATKAPATTVPRADSASPSAAALQDVFVAVVHRILPSVVEVSTSSGLGSGIVYDDKGDIVTNAHVVGQSTQFTITFNQGRTLPAQLVGTDPADDLAVVKVTGSSSAPVASFADSDKVQVGDIALAVGNPLGLSSSVTEGIVSYVGRTVSEGGGVVLASAIQTSAAINPGNSGGALADINGAVIGIPTLAALDPQLGGGAAGGIGFAIPSNTVKRVADQLIATGKVTNSGRAALGITGASVTDQSGQPAGVLIRSLVSGGAAASAGLKAGDVIVSVNRTPTPDLETLLTVLAGLRPGAQVPVDVIRSDGSTNSVTVTLQTLQ